MSESESSTEHEISTDAAPPQVSRLMLNGFVVYLHRYFRRHFHSVCVAFESELDVPPNTPLIVYVNHASWWDPMLGLILQKNVFPNHTLYAPIDAAALKRYQILAKLGFFGVEQHDRRGAASFLRAARRILAQDGASIWLTPEGRFADPRDHAATFQPGLAHLVSRLETGVVLPLAVEYPFWEERLPEALARFGEPLNIAEHDLSKEEWGKVLQTRLRQTQSDLASASIQRCSDEFQVLISGRAGVGFFYDALRRFKSWLLGKRFHAEHGEKLQ